MRFKERLFSMLSPELLTGVSVSVWFRILRENKFSVDSPFLLKALVTTLFSLRNSLAGSIENAIWSERIRHTKVDSPLFVVGVFRSGTTHLHNLLALDQRFAFPSHYEVSFPQIFLTLEALDRRLLGLLMPSTRPQDNVTLNFSQPHEDEVALCGIIGRTFLMDLAFPRNTSLYRKYYTLQDLNDHDLQEWEQGLKWFLQKVSLKKRSPLILKSPGHMCRIKTLLKAFPDARFIHIHRNPFDVYASWFSMLRILRQQWAFQRPVRESAEQQSEEDILKHYRIMTDAWFNERSLIPSGRLFELSYSDLVREPTVQLEKLYSHLGFEHFEEFRPKLDQYLHAGADYKANQHPPLTDSLRRKISQEWSHAFDQLGYPR